jgi:signal transduction histidine kinase/ActR/RegA family two-component response regulator
VAIHADEMDETHPFFIVNDLKKESRFKDLPFVTGEPHSRFYAGTPLRSGSDINLGCLFVLDSEPREGLSVNEKDALAATAALVMDYLQVSRQASEGRRALRLSHGLHLFVDGDSSFADNAPKSSQSCSSVSSRSRSSHLRTSRSTSPQDYGQEPYSTWSALSDTPLGYDENRPSSASSNDGSEIGVPGSPTRSVLNLQQSDQSSSESTSSRHWLFQRAANLLRQSLDLDGGGGVIFMGTSENSSENPSGNSPDSHGDLNEFNTRAPVLALSTRDDPLSGHMVSPEENPAVAIDHGFLNQLTRRYAKGRLWSFHHDGTLSTSDEDLSTETSRKQKKNSRASETESLNAYFPAACQVAFVPLWNGTDSQWFAGCFCWTPHPTRVFSRAVDLSSIFAFASSIMTEYSRVESVIADRQKGDFISSISHELRSPLHGVLAAAEFLADTHLDDFQSSVIETINACGRTLLDTMNQVLDFSKITSLERSKRRFKRGKDPWKAKSTDDAPLLDTFVSTDVAILAEDVVDSVALGHFHMQRSAASTNHPSNFTLSSLSKTTKGDNETTFASNVDLIVDIADNDWMYQVQPGSLRRLIMNLLGNSLKYTEKGLISVSLKATEMDKGRSRRQGLQDMITLTVSDTGKGISKEYLQKRLFTPFAQENTLSAGTGLGLSIVRGIVRTLNGKISIQSRIGEGTTVKVSLPFERPVGEEIPQSTLQAESVEGKHLSPFSKLEHANLKGKRVAIWGIDYVRLDEDHFWSSIARYATGWYGLQLVSCSDKDLDIMFATENSLPPGTSQDFPSSLPSLLVFCDEASSHGDPLIRWPAFADSMAIIRRPCGPQKLARGISGCLDLKQISSDLKDLRPGLIIAERPKPTTRPSHLDTAKCDTSAPKPNTEYSPNPPSSGTSPGSYLPSSCSSSIPPALDTLIMGQVRPRILVVDDNLINLNLLITYLKKRNITTLDRAEDGQAAVNLARKMPGGYDIIFMDISMPVMDGFEATRAIRAMEKERQGSDQAKIIAFTGLASPTHESKARDAGVNMFLTKPVSFKEVLRILSGWKEPSE